MAMAGRRTLLTAGAVGVAAGTMGTWFELSHGVFCIPVLTLPPLQLSHQALKRPLFSKLKAAFCIFSALATSLCWSF